MGSILTSVERVNRMMDRQDHDRVPRFDYYWNETLERWNDEGLVGSTPEVHDLLQADIGKMGGVHPCVFPGRRDVVEEDEQRRVVINGFGATVREWKGRTGTPEHVGFDCSTSASWYEHYKPALLENALQVNLDHVRTEHAATRRAQRWTMFGTFEAYEFMKRLMGDEIALIAMATEPEWIVDVSNTFTDILIQNLEAVVEAGCLPDGVFLSADMGYNHGPLFSPKAYRELIRPDHERLNAWFKEHGVRVVFHTDGNVNALVDQYVEIGFDSLHPLEGCAHMDIRELAPKFGEELSFWGNIDKSVTGTNDLEKVEQEVCEVLKAGMANKGYGFHSDHSVPPSVSWKTYQFIIQLVKQHGWYE